LKTAKLRSAVITDVRCNYHIMFAEFGEIRYITSARSAAVKVQI